jgi:hypothetical protein
VSTPVGVFIDAIRVRSDHVTNRSIYVATKITSDENAGTADSSGGVQNRDRSVLLVRYIGLVSVG